MIDLFSGVMCRSSGLLLCVLVCPYVACYSVTVCCVKGDNWKKQDSNSSEPRKKRAQGRGAQQKIEKKRIKKKKYSRWGMLKRRGRWKGP